jgi:hypothetical protein
MLAFVAIAMAASPYDTPVRATDAMRVHLSVELIGTSPAEHLRVCRILVNRSAKEAVVERGWSLSAYILFLDRRGDPFRDPEDRTFHDSFVPPPPPLPSGGPDPNAFVDLKPGEGLTDCVDLSLPKDRRWFRVRSNYFPQQDQKYFPRGGPGSIVISRAQGFYSSNLCTVDLRRQRVAC